MIRLYLGGETTWEEKEEGVGRTWSEEGCEVVFLPRGYRSVRHCRFPWLVFRFCGRSTRTLPSPHFSRVGTQNELDDAEFAQAAQEAARQRKCSCECGECCECGGDGKEEVACEGY